VIGWALEAWIGVTALMLLVLAVRGTVARFFGAGWAYALWLVPALRLVLPPLPSFFHIFALPPAASIIPAAAGGTAPLPAEAGPGQWLPIMLVMWVGGAVLFMIHQWLSYRAFLRRLGLDAHPAKPPSYGGIELQVSAAAEGPLALGLLRRRIVVPPDFLDRYSADERRLALEHELTHHRRGDIWWNVAAATVLALNWFNPVAWIAFRAFRADQELACDAAVAARASSEERCDYARALVKSASRPGLIAACAFNSASQLKRRLRMMRGHKVSAARRAGGFATLALLGLTSLSLASPTPEPAAPVQAALAAPASPAAGAVPFPAPAAQVAAAAEAAPRPARRTAPRAAARAPRRAVALAAAPAPAPAAAPAPAEAPVLAEAPEADRFAVVRFEEHRLVATRHGSGPHVVLISRVTRAPREPLARSEAIRAHLHRERLVHLAEATAALRRIRLETLIQKQETH
jgi:beta-lactamase regulating signal transducer with metallopeptidase domain